MKVISKSLFTTFLCLVFLSVSGCSTAKRSTHTKPVTMSKRIQPERQEHSVVVKIGAALLGAAIGHSVAKAITDD